jgi:hypothetical protein
MATLPTDDELNATVAKHEETRRTEVKRLLADPEVYDWRLKERRSREYEGWVKIKGRWKRRIILNKAHAGSAAVNEGSIKAIRTTLPKDHEDHLGSLPERPSIAWLRRIDANTSIDQGRKQTLQGRREQQTDDLAMIEEILEQDATGRTPKRKTT